MKQFATTIANREYHRAFTSGHDSFSAPLCLFGDIASVAVSLFVFCIFSVMNLNILGFVLLPFVLSIVFQRRQKQTD